MTGGEVLLEQGRAEGRAELLLRQLQIKFGPLAEPIERRVRNALADELDRWAERVLTAKAINDVFDG
jgi:hypothetical protein